MGLHLRVLPQGLDSPVGEGGATLSGGQRQRLAIARALLANPDFFIFDEATSALDTVSEKLIHDALGTAMAGRTAFVIAHRLATVKSCDRILVLQNGQIAQDGPYLTPSSPPPAYSSATSSTAKCSRPDAIRRSESRIDFQQFLQDRFERCAPFLRTGFTPLQTQSNRR